MDMAWTRRIGAVGWLLLVAVTAGCAVNPVSGRPELTLISAKQEQALGAEEAKKVEAGMGFADDSSFSPFLNQLGQRLAEHSPRKNVTFQFHIVDMAEPNAFALPGGYIYVSRGLLALTNTEGELAGVVGHEIGHVAGKHAVQRISKQAPLAVVFGLASGITGLVSSTVGDLIGGIGNLAQSAIFSPYSRSQETEADEVGQKIAAEAGWNPIELSTFLANLEREVTLHEKKPRKPSFFDSHPVTADRVADTARHAKLLTRAMRDPISPTNETYLARLNGIVVGPRAANGVFHDREFLHPDLGIFVKFPEKWPHENAPEKIVAVAPKGDAAVVLEVATKGDDPLDGARMLGKAKHIDLAAKTELLSINGLPAARAVIPTNGRAHAEVTWIAHGGLIFQLVAVASSEQFKTFQPEFEAVAQSFHPLSGHERARITETRIRLMTARKGETIEALAARSHSAWKADEVAVINGLAAATLLREGQLLKVAVEERYETRE
ncbi:MAG: Beta-barrel assembly-enhancing protease [Nitrospira sp.]|nr:Beta-barrel assembly-enhancing protease [Nitrospira sp.]